MTLPASQTVDPRLIERSVQVRWPRLDHAASGHRRTDHVLAWTPIDAERASISAWEEDRTGTIRNIIAPREVSWIGLWRGPALHLDAFEHGECVLALSVEWGTQDEEDCLRLLYVRCTPLARYGFMPRHCSPPVPRLAAHDVITGVDASRYIA